MRVGIAQACEQKPRQCFASVNHDPVDKVAIQEGNLLMRLLAAAVDAARVDALQLVPPGGRADDHSPSPFVVGR